MDAILYWQSTHTLPDPNQRLVFEACHQVVKLFSLVLRMDALQLSGYASVAPASPPNLHLSMQMLQHPMHYQLSLL